MYMHMYMYMFPNLQNEHVYVWYTIEADIICYLWNLMSVLTRYQISIAFISYPNIRMKHSGLGHVFCQDDSIFY